MELPTFKEGQGVIFHKGMPVEDKCPYCGYITNSFPAREDIITTILYSALGLNTHCSKCERIYLLPDGWYVLAERGNLGYFITAPYTLIEAIEEEQCAS